MTPSCRILVAALLLAILPSGATAEIYRWEDAQGTIHYTDDLSNVPPEQRKNAAIVVKEPESRPGTEGGPTGAPSPSTREPAGAPATVRPADPEDMLRQEIRQLRARIAAKENLIRAVEERRSLATNPLRNRFVDPGDLDLYEKYKVELPGDRDRLRELEARVPPAPRE